MSKLLKEFEERKLHTDEKFKFLVYPRLASKYQYVISNYGRVFSYITGKELKYWIDKDGYKRIGLRRKLDNGKYSKSPLGIHRMVAFTFIKKPENTLNIVNHKDGVKTNNYYKNLEWTTPLGNTRHAIENNLQTNSGPNAPGAKYSEELIRNICMELKNGNDAFMTYVILTGDSKVKDIRLYTLIYEIGRKKRHASISQEYGLDNKVQSKTRKKFKKEDVDMMKKMILDGKSNLEIIKFFGGTKTKEGIGKRIFDKLTILRRELGVCSTIRES